MWKGAARVHSLSAAARFRAGLESTRMTSIAAGRHAPGFSLKDLDGREYSLAGATGAGPVVLAFFKVSCPVCQLTFPFLERLYQRHGRAGVTFLGISQDDGPATRPFQKKFGITFPVLLDARGYPVSNAYELTTVPTVFLIDRDGRATVSSTGFNKADLEAIAGVLAAPGEVPGPPLFRPDEQLPAHKPG